MNRIPFDLKLGCTIVLKRENVVDSGVNTGVPHAAVAEFEPEEPGESLTIHLEPGGGDVGSASLEGGTRLVFKGALTEGARRS